jgi:hypothetical protein
MSEKEIISRILDSQTFKNKEVLKNLLQYFFESYLKKKEISEKSIANDVFQRKDFDGTEDTIVRVNLFKLRHLLKLYYLNDGQKDAYKVEIPKGIYQLKFSQIGISFQAPASNKFKWEHIAIGGLFIALLISQFILQKGKTDAINPFWASFNNQQPTKVILCPPYFKVYVHKSSGRAIAVRDMAVNSKAEEDSLMSEIFSEEDFKNPEVEYSYFMSSNVYPLPYIFKGLYTNKVSQIELLSLSEFNNKELSNNNIVFVGSIKSLDYLADLVESSSVKLAREPLRLVLNDSIDLVSENAPKDKYVDYALLVKMQGENENSILVISSMFTTGINGVLKKLEDEVFLNTITKNDIDLLTEFELIVKVSGVNYSNLDVELVHFAKR